MNELLASMDKQHVDYTQFFVSLSADLEYQSNNVTSLFENASDFIEWHVKWNARLQRDELDTPASIALMQRNNPIYIPRNHKVEEALTLATEEADYSKFETLLKCLKQAI